jgi:hypothetical protein
VNQILEHRVLRPRLDAWTRRNVGSDKNVG